jgi:hypothetical protein
VIPVLLAFATVAESVVDWPAVMVAVAGVAVIVTAGGGALVCDEELEPQPVRRIKKDKLTTTIRHDARGRVSCINFRNIQGK